MAATSDHRFFDRYWFNAIDPSGGLGLVAGFGVYKNMGTCDGFVSVQCDQRQHNLRLARPLGDVLDGAVLGPFEITVVEPFRELRLQLAENEPGMAVDLVWTSDFRPYVERHHLQIRGQRVVHDSTRYDQVGRWNGWIELEGKRYEVSDWWGVRDHSWGVRPGVGGFEPPGPDGSAGSLFLIWATFGTDAYACHFQLHEDGAGKRLYFDGQLDRPRGDGRPAVRAVDVTHQASFIPGTKVYDRIEFNLTLEDGTVIEIRAEPLLRSWAQDGWGYGRGYRDGGGLGAWRGEVAEYDVYDLSDPARVSNDGADQPTQHREQSCRLTVNGEPAIGHIPVLAWGPIQSYGLE